MDYQAIINIMLCYFIFYTLLILSVCLHIMLSRNMKTQQMFRMNIYFKSCDAYF